MKKFLLSAAMILSASTVSAATVGYSLSLSTTTAVDGSVNFDKPQIAITNTSTAAKLTSFSITIGDTSRNFDKVLFNDAGVAGLNGGTQTLLIGDTGQGGLRTDEIKVGFDGFDAGESSFFKAELDLDDVDSSEVFSTVLFNNGGAGKSLVTAVFSDGSILSMLLKASQSDQSAEDGYLNGRMFSFSQSQDVADKQQNPDNAPQPDLQAQVVPLPAGGLLLLTGLGAMAASRRKRRG